MNLDDYLKKIKKLRTGISYGHVKPHKPVMVLTMLSLIENGKITSNRIDYSPQLLELFKKFFDIVRSEQDSLTPLLPFFIFVGMVFGLMLSLLAAFPPDSSSRPPRLFPDRLLKSWSGQFSSCVSGINQSTHLVIRP